jgi:hypothetical protein
MTAVRRPALLLAALALLVPVEAGAADGGRAPANDAVAAAHVVESLPYSDDRDVTGATLQDGEPAGCFEGSGSSVWYRYAPSEDLRLDVTTDPSHYDTTVEVFEADQDGGPGPLLDCDDNGFGNGSVHENLMVSLEAGRSYLVRVAAREGQVGVDQHLRLQLREYEQLRAEYRVHPVAELVGTEVRVRHTVLCNAEAEGRLRYEVTQGAGPVGASARGLLTPFGCSRPAGPREPLDDTGFAVLNLGPETTGTFRPGPALMTASTFACRQGRYPECRRDSWSFQLVVVPRP